MRTSAVVLLSAVVLAACSSGENEDLRQWMNEVGKDIKGKIPQLPQVKPYEPVPYDAGQVVDPFKAAKIIPEQKQSGGSGVQPDLDRPREPLEAYPLESLKFVGVMSRKRTSYAIIQVDGSLYQVKAGNYVGQNFGVITRISETETTLKELVQDAAGDWVERTSALLLQVQEAKKVKAIKYYLLGLVGWFSLAGFPAMAQDAGQNSIEAITVAQQAGVLNVKLAFKEALTALPAGFSVAAPARIALDFANTVNGLGKNSQTFNEGDLKSVNLVQTEGRTRLVLNLTQAMTYESRIDGKDLLLALSPTVKQGAVAARIEHFSEARASPEALSIRDIGFRRGKDGEARITVDLSDPNAGIDIRQQGQNLIVDFVKVNVPDALRKRLDVTDFATPVVSLNTTQQGTNARMTITPRGLWEHNAYQTDSQFVIEVRQIIENPNKLVQGSRGGYQGEKLSLNFQNVEVRRLLQVIGEFTGMNMVVSDSVGGAITLILKDVPWDQALDIILQQKGLDMRKNGNVILIAPREEIATKEKLEYESKAQIGDLEPLRTENFQLNYQKAEEIKKLLTDSSQRMLSKRGSAVVDTRTNILFVQDTPSRLEDVRQLIAKVDLAVRQVMIEARIVEATDSFSKNLGVNLSWSSTKSNSSTTSTVNLPAAPSTGTAGTFGLSLYNSAATRVLTAEISALEADGRGKVISSPRVLTANQVEALIEQGVEIPYQQATSSGATSVSFRKANLSLKVKPQITPDGKITMTLDINKDTPNTSLSTGSGIAIDTKHVKTEVLVENGGTVVIGGIFTQTITDTTTRIPVFGDLPYIGWLFKNRAWADDKTELMVFITPKIVAESLAVR